MKSRKQIIATVASVCVAASSFAFAQGQAPAPAPTITGIEVQYAGPATVSKSRILANMRTQVGKPYSDLAVEEDIRNLYGTGSIANVRIYGEPQADGVKVIVVVQTKASVKAVKIEGASEIKEKALRKLLVTKPGEQLTESNLETDRQKILEAYRERGFKDTKVTASTALDEANNKVTVTYAISESAKTIVKHIRFEGNASIQESELRKQLKTKPHSILSVFTKAGRLDSEKLSEDVQTLKEYYQNRGYLDVKIGDPQVERVDAKADVDLIFPVNEGAQYHVGKIIITGAKVYRPEQIAAQLKLQSGAIYSPKAVGDDAKTIGDMLGSKGYVDAQVTPESSPGGRLVNNITYRVEEGTQSYVQRINISGNTRTKDKVLRRELAVAPGEVYNTVRVEASKQRLQNLNYFERVDVYPSDTGTPGTKDVNVVVNEKHTGSLNFGAGFSSIDKLLGFVEVTQSNFDITDWPHFVGGGQRFRTRLQYGTSRKDFIVSLTEPYFLDYQLAVGGEAFYHDASFLSSVYNQRNVGFDLFTRKAIDEFLAWRLDYRLENIDIYNVNKDASEIIRNEEGSRLKSQVGPSLTYDSRDSVFLSRRGTRAELSTYVAGGPLGGDIDIYGFDLEASHYILLPWDTILTLSGEIAAVSTWSSGKEVPIFDRLYLGGSNNLRGFKFRDIGPKDNHGQPIGGDSLARATVEYTYPIIDRVRGAFFFDAGVVNAGSYDYGASDLASDAGIGVRLDLPIGPIRLDYGIPVQKGDSTSNSGHFNFNIGYQY